MTKAENWKATLAELENPVSAIEYAEKKNITVWYVQKLCRDGKLKCKKLGSTWFIESPIS